MAPPPLSPGLLFVDDDVALFPAMHGFLDDMFTVYTATNVVEALQTLQDHNDIVVILSDVCMPEQSGFDLLQNVKATYGDRISLFFITGFGSISDACEAIRLGAEDYLVKPIDGSMIRSVLQRFVKNDCAAVADGDFHGMVAQSKAMHAMFEHLQKYASSRAPVLIEGETGTGKELAASAIHALSDRRQGPLVVLNCASLPDALLESELFGHEKGAFTGAMEQRQGRFEMADQGTLFLDEIGELSVTVQAKMLRVLQNGEFYRVGGNQALSADVRIIAASNKSLQAMVDAGSFRSDLMYRLNTLHLELPPLRKRDGDVALLSGRYLAWLAERYQRPVPQLDSELLSLLTAYPWPGNVRELNNAVERAFVLSEGVPVLKKEHFHFLAFEAAVMDEAGSSSMSMEHLEKKHIQYVLKRSTGGKSQAAQRLGISRDTLYRKIKKYEL